ncbi:MAG: response regulator [Hydrogenophaga sp.]|uniref:response regulator n=1 Tax=Hydrogenophaga sp. TaxID=1904254 RepID=UPI00271AFADF|nr:response regulator [Hydrogenophaga sp.]MDO9504135.1 response regulator [Hydrogenophaga sp.]MDP3203267.1 response regulator [Hydrogenophaga sp.]MDP3626321.1 response regulator [Hydrogenophaga sp.]
MNHREARILVVSDNAVDAEQVCSMLRDRYPHVEATTDPMKSDAVFDRVKPQVLVLAFKSLEACERFYLGLYRRSEVIQLLTHRTLLLCDKESVRRAFDLCLQEVFDDYVLFWPLVHDAKRLAMSVHLALGALDQELALAPLSELATLARRAETLEDQLAQQVRLGRVHAQNAQNTARQAQASVSRAMGGLSERILATGLDNALTASDASRVGQAFDKLQREALIPTLEEVVQAAQPMRDWVDTITAELAEPLQAARDLVQHAKVSRPHLLVVDDDEFMRRLLTQLLTAARYDVHSVGTALDAQQFLMFNRPDLILMDFRLPDSDGILLTRELKGSALSHDIPVIMLTGQTEKQVIVDSRKAGAVDFVAKPFNRDILLKKVAQHLIH